MGFANLAALANANRNYTNHEGTSAPSMPDYMALTTGGYYLSNGHFGGSPGGVDSLSSVGAQGNTQNIMNQLGTAGFSWKTYEEGVASAGYNSWGSDLGNNHYATRHCPAAFFSTTKAAGVNHGNGRYDFDELARDITNKTLPDFFIITPNLVNDGHAVSGGTNWGPTNQWIANGNGGLFPGMSALASALRADGVVIVMPDNVPHADTSAPITGTGIVYCVAVGPNVTNGTVSTYSNHFGLLRAIQSAFGVPAFTQAGVDSNYTNATLMSLGVSTTQSAPTITGQTITGGSGGGGVPVVGDTLTANATVSGNPTPTVTYKWVHHGTTTSLGTAHTYSPVTADVGLQLDCIISATNGVSPNATATAGPTAAVTSGAGAPSNSVTDTFGTPSTNSISAADDGHTWQILQGTASQFNVAGGFLNITAIAGNAPIADIVGYSQSAEENLMRYEFTSLAAGAEQSIGLGIRMTDAQNYDRCIVTQLPTGSTNIKIQKQIANVNTDIVSSTTIPTQAANTKYWLRFRAILGAYYAKIWADGTTEPASWTIQGTDPNWSTSPGNTSGSVGIRLQCLTGNTNLATYKIDRFSSLVPTGVSGTVTYEYSLDGGAFTATGNAGADLKEALAGLSNGYHYISVRPVDSVKGSGPANTYVWLVNSTSVTPPVITSAVDGNNVPLTEGIHTQSTSATISFTTVGGTGVYCRITQNNTVGGFFGPVTSPLALTNLAVGAITLEFQAWDASLNKSPSTTLDFTIDPATVGGGTGSGLYTKQIVLPSVAGSSITDIIYVRATDTNTTPITTQVTRSVVVSVPLGTPPAVSILSPVDGSTVFSSDGSVDVLVQAENPNDTIVSVQITVDGNLFIDCIQQSDPNQWLGTITLPLGVSSTITAVATDTTDGLQGSDSVTVLQSTAGGGPIQGVVSPTAATDKPVAIELFIMDLNQNDVGVVFPQDLNYVEPMNAPPTISFGINLEDSMAKIGKLDPNKHDWRLERDGQVIGAGILAQGGIQIDTDERTMTVQGFGWLGYFQYQYMLYDPTLEITGQNLSFVNQDLFNVTRSVVDSVAGGANSIPLTYDHALSGITVTQQFLASDLNDLLTIVTDLGGQVQGFDFEVTPACHFKMYSPQRGTFSNLILEYGRNIQNIKYNNPGIKANRVNAVGSGTSSSQTVALAENKSNQARNRLYTDIAQFSNLTSYNQINGLAKSQLNLDVQDQITMTITSRPAPGEDQFNLASVGDWVKVVFDLEYVNVDGWFRMTQRTFKPDNDGNEIIEYQFSPNTINTGQ